MEAPADSAAGEIPFELVGGGGAALLIPVRINGEGPFDFIMDTGASITCVNEELAQRLDLPQRRGQFGMGAGVGGSGPVRLVGIDSIGVGAAQAFDLTACVLDLRQLAAIGRDVHGLVGLNFLRAFRITLDFEREVAIFQDPGESRSRPSGASQE